MKSFYILPILGMAAISFASAGQIEIGANNGSGVTASGLTSAYINTVSQGASPWSGEKAYAGTLFEGATISGSSLNGVAETSAVGTGGASTTPTYQNGFQQFTDANTGVTFGMLDDNANGFNFWGSASSSQANVSTTITAPVNVSGVSNAYIMLNDYFGVNSSVTQTDTVEFFFSGGGTDTFTLTNANQIQDSLVCLTGSTATCSTFAQSTTSPNTDSAWTGTYTVAGSTVYANTSGNVVLSDLDFNISAFSGSVLQSIAITDGNNLQNSSRLALSAITVTGANAALATPEPGTVLLFLAGLGVIGFFGRRRMVRQ